MPTRPATFRSAALDIAFGFVIGKCNKRHRAAEFFDFLEWIDAQVPMIEDMTICRFGAHKQREPA